MHACACVCARADEKTSGSYLVFGTLVGISLTSFGLQSCVCMCEHRDHAKRTTITSNVPRSRQTARSRQMHRDHAKRTPITPNVPVTYRLR